MTLPDPLAKFTVNVIVVLLLFKITTEVFLSDVSHWCEIQHNWSNQKESERKRRVHGYCELIMTAIQAQQSMTHEQQHHGNARGRRKKEQRA